MSTTVSILAASWKWTDVSDSPWTFASAEISVLIVFVTKFKPGDYSRLESKYAECRTYNDQLKNKLK